MYRITVIDSSEFFSLHRFDSRVIGIYRFPISTWYRLDITFGDVDSVYRKFCTAPLVEGIARGAELRIGNKDVL